MKRLIFALIFLLLPASAWAATITAENGGGNWSATTTWVGGAVPDSVSDTAVIPATLTAAVVLDDSRTIPATTVEDEVYGLVQGGGVTTTLGGALTVGNGTGLDGKFVFGPSATLALGVNSLVLNNAALHSNSTAENWATITGSGAINTATVLLPSPKQNIDLSYVSFQNTGLVYFGAGLNGGALTSLLDVSYCTFVGTGAITFGQAGWSSSSCTIIIEHNDFRNLTGKVIITGQVGTANRRFKYNTLSTDSTRQEVQATTNTDFTGSVFYRITPKGAHTQEVIFDGVFIGTGPSESGDHILVPAKANCVFANSFLYSPSSALNPHVANIYYNLANELNVTDNVFEIYGNEPNILMVSGGNATSTGSITGNLHIGRGAFFNTVGNQTFGTITVKNNTVYTDGGGIATHQGLYLSENGDVTGTLNFSSNLHKAVDATLSASLWDNTGAYTVIAYSDYNNFYGLSDSTPYNNLTVSSGQSNDIINTVDPQFVDDSRRLSSWAQTKLGTDGTDTAAIATLLAINGYNATTKTQSDTPSGAIVSGSPDALTDWTRAGFAPTNATLSTAGEGGTYIGAIESQAADDYRPAALMMGM